MNGRLVGGACGAGGALSTRPPRYVLEVAREVLGAARFADLAARGHRLLEDQPGWAAQVLDDALALWRGDAYAGPDDGLAHAERHRLEALRARALDDRIGADRRCGRPEAAIRALAPLVDADPRDERALGRLVLAP